MHSSLRSIYLSFFVNGLIHEFMWQLRISRQAKVISSVSNKGKNDQLSLENVLFVVKKKCMNQGLPHRLFYFLIFYTPKYIFNEHVLV